jgi:hypothetical protein
VTLIQRFGSALNLNIHFHMLVLDGAYLVDTEPPVFRRIAPPSEVELQALVEQLAERIGRALERQGVLARDTENSYLELAPEAGGPMGDLLGHSCLLAAFATGTAACGSLSAQEQPAVIASPTAESRAELVRVVSGVLNGQPVALADDALTRESVLLIEQRTPPGPQGRAATGRTLEAPERFILVLRGSSCMLVRAADGRAVTLAEARCVPAAP